MIKNDINKLLYDTNDTMYHKIALHCDTLYYANVIQCNANYDTNMIQILRH